MVSGNGPCQHMASASKRCRDFSNQTWSFMLTHPRPQFVKREIQGSNPKVPIVLYRDIAAPLVQRLKSDTAPIVRYAIELTGSGLRGYHKHMVNQFRKPGVNCIPRPRTIRSDGLRSLPEAKAWKVRLEHEGAPPGAGCMFQRKPPCTQRHCRG